MPNNRLAKKLNDKTRETQIAFKGRRGDADRITFQCRLPAGEPRSRESSDKFGIAPEPLVGVIVSADQVTDHNLAQWRTEGVSVALTLTADSNSNNERQAAEAIRSNALVLDYFIEVGRCPELAAAHPEWMASLQGHPEWRKLFPDTPIPTKRQVIKNFPWVPILYQESSDAHIARIKRLLDGKPAPSRIWLNDLQGAPSACGCGHPLCRWTADYGPIKTASSLDHHAAAEFVRRVRAIAGDAEIIPVLVGECEADDKDTLCCGVACFEGQCWKDFTKQLDTLATESDRMGMPVFTSSLSAIWIVMEIQPVGSRLR